MIDMLVSLIVLSLVLYLLFYLLGAIALPQPVRTVITVLAALVVLLYLIQRYGLLGGL